MKVNFASGITCVGTNWRASLSSFAKKSYLRLCWFMSEFHTPHSRNHHIPCKPYPILSSYKNAEYASFICININEIASQEDICCDIISGDVNVDILGLFQVSKTGRNTDNDHIHNPVNCHPFLAQLFIELKSLFNWQMFGILCQDQSPCKELLLVQ